MLRKLLAVIAGLIAVFILTIYCDDRSWFYYIGLAVTGMIIGFIANNRFWILGVMVGVIVGFWQLSIIEAGYVFISNWRTLLPVVFAEITGCSIAHLRTHTKQSQINP